MGPANAGKPGVIIQEYLPPWVFAQATDTLVIDFRPEHVLSSTKHGAFLLSRKPVLTWPLMA